MANTDQIIQMESREVSSSSLLNAPKNAIATLRDAVSGFVLE